MFIGVDCRACVLPIMIFLLFWVCTEFCVDVCKVQFNCTGVVVSEESLHFAEIFGMEGTLVPRKIISNVVLSVNSVVKLHKENADARRSN